MEYLNQRNSDRLVPQDVSITRMFINVRINIFTEIIKKNSSFHEDRSSATLHSRNLRINA